MRYLFILGRNIDLSVAEVKSFLEKEKIIFKVLSVIKNGMLIETEKKLSKIIKHFGGVISIGEVLATGSSEEIEKELDKKTLYYGNNNKLNYVVFNFNGNSEDILFYLKKRFKQEKLKATEKKLTGNIKLQDEENVPNVSSNLINEQFFIFENNFGRIIEKVDYASIEKRDMQKPVRRSELSISPRLAKILINLSQVKDGILLDPFCGIGVILQEALLQDIRVVGIDKDESAIDNAELNLKWFDFSKDNYKLINGDSSRINIPRVQGIATEPDFGELQRKIPSEEKAQELIKKFEKLIIRVLRNLKRNVHGRIAFTLPLIKTRKKNIACDFDYISSIVGLKIVKGFPINEFRSTSIVGRSILVLER